MMLNVLLINMWGSLWILSLEMLFSDLEGSSAFQLPAALLGRHELFTCPSKLDGIYPFLLFQLLCATLDELQRLWEKKIQSSMDMQGTGVSW